MADITVKGLMKVKTLKADFKKAYGATLRVYVGKKFADDDATLASIRSADAKAKGELSVRGNMKVGNFEDKFKEEFGITIQVANPADTALVDNSITLTAAGQL